MTIQGKITGVRTVGVPVTDQDRALDFYVGTLGLEKRLDADMGGGRRWIEVGPAGGGTSLAPVPARAGAPPGGGGSPPMFACRAPDGKGVEIVERRWPPAGAPRGPGRVPRVLVVRRDRRG